MTTLEESPRYVSHICGNYLIEVLLIDEIEAIVAWTSTQDRSHTGLSKITYTKQSTQAILDNASKLAFDIWDVHWRGENIAFDEIAELWDLTMETASGSFDEPHRCGDITRLLDGSYTRHLCAGCGPLEDGTSCCKGCAEWIDRELRELSAGRD